MNGRGEEAKNKRNKKNIGLRRGSGKRTGHDGQNGETEDIEDRSVFFTWSFSLPRSTSATIVSFGIARIQTKTQLEQCERHYAKLQILSSPFHILTTTHETSLHSVITPSHYVCKMWGPLEFRPIVLHGKNWLVAAGMC